MRAVVVYALLCNTESINCAMTRCLAMGSAVGWSPQSGFHRLSGVGYDILISKLYRKAHH
jgi:hypothetical protein